MECFNRKRNLNLLAQVQADLASSTDEQDIKAYKALKRMLKAAPIALVLFLVSTIVGMAFALYQMPSYLHEAKRYGTVTDDGMITYVQNERMYKTPEEVGLENYDLVAGEEVTLYFTSTTDELIIAVPESQDNTDEYYMNLLLVTFAPGACYIFFLFVIQRFTPFGSDYYKYLKRHKAKYIKEKTPLWINIVSFILPIFICLFLLSFSLLHLVGHIQRTQRIQQTSDAIHGAADAADKLTDSMDKVTGELENIDTSEHSDAVSEDAQNIKDILDGMQDLDIELPEITIPTEETPQTE